LWQNRCPSVARRRAGLQKARRAMSSQICLQPDEGGLEIVRGVQHVLDVHDAAVGNVVRAPKKTRWTRWEAFAPALHLGPHIRSKKWRAPVPEHVPNLAGNFWQLPPRKRGIQ